MGRPTGSKKTPGMASLGSTTTRSAQYGGHEAPVGRPQRLATKAFTDQWPVYVKNSKRGLKQRSRTTIEDFFGSEGWASSGPARFAPIWTDDDETDLIEEYSASLIKRCVDMISATDSDLHALWKTCIRLLDMDPINLMEDLEVNIEENGTISHDGRVQANAIWSAGFCKKLSRIICHPFWRGPWRHDILTFTIRYAAMCRGDDRRPFNFPNPTACRVLDGLFDVQDMSDMPLHDRHMKLRDEAVANRILPSIESDLLAQLGTLVFVTPRAHSEGPVVVSVLDLSRIICALDNLQSDGLSSHISTEVSYQMFLAARGTQDVPVGIDQLKTAYQNCWLNHRRERIVWEREAAQEMILSRGDPSRHIDS
ncbi:hypothetical protein EDB80DRAFT_147512 [Ilyonectria destructans]|nr:hypothetical protein EDB80DRAFT_147512 [Ilyonectria destructans]